MDKAVKEIDFLLGDRIEDVKFLSHLTSSEIFSDLAINFLSDISKELLELPFIRQYPDVATFAFFCRAANLKIIQKSYSDRNKLRIGRGILFHISPGNVPVNFAYSLVAGVLTGNINIIRLPSKNFDQVSIIVDVIKKVVHSIKYNSFYSKRLFLVKYNRESVATQMFSSICDLRIIWGGDLTINQIREKSILPHSREVTFPDRYSIAVIDAEAYLNTQNKHKVAVDFYNDTFLFDQNACTSPQTIIWRGSAKSLKSAKREFWSNVDQILRDKQYDIQPIISVDKLTTFYSHAISQRNIELEPTNSNRILRVKNNSLSKDIHLFRCSSGYFNEVCISSLDDLISIINRKYQTMAYLGFSAEELENWALNNKPVGIDRIVPLGRTMDFSLVWDGIDLVSAFSRQIEIY